ncbi:ABC transporter substrate-binding protein [Spirillospora sp. CA-294931]|uniref:ABC transporter substrate-binding protein n=1 Tax=Spirillospora sp. CA-294931 TaxID=3240042 RepID=UPI003D92BA09
MRISRTGGAIAAGFALVSLGLAGCGGAKTSDGKGGTGSGGTVRLAINPWTGYEANAAVIAAVLEKELGYKVEKKNLKEEVAWQGFESGEVDAIVENWGHESLKKKYLEEKKVAVSAGSTGVKGEIGWYVPEWMAKKYPDITDSRNLNKYASLFKTSESGGKGQVLDGDPSFVTNDKALVKNLKLDYQVVEGGSEAALVKSAVQAENQQKALLFYFWKPHVLHLKAKFAKVNLPKYTPGCDTDPKKVACDYPPYDLDKIVSKRFADKGGKAYQLVKNFRWTEADQNTVAGYIANDGMTADRAAKKWVADNEAKWKAWLPK